MIFVDELLLVRTRRFNSCTDRNSAGTPTETAGVSPCAEVAETVSAEFHKRREMLGPEPALSLF